jgi:hypothetical protein
MIFETGSEEFTIADSSVDVLFDDEYSVIPVVVATAVDNSGTKNTNLNVTVINTTLTGFTIEISDMPTSTITVKYTVFGE